METIVLTPKRTALMEARIDATDPSFTVEVPETDAELASIVGYNEDGTPKLTFKSLAQEAIANRQQAVISKLLAEGAVTSKDANNKTVFAPDQFVTDAELVEILRKAPPEAYRLLVGERASNGRKSTEAIKAEAAAAIRTAQLEQYRSMIANATPDARPIFVQMAVALGFTELA